MSRRELAARVFGSRFLRGLGKFAGGAGLRILAYHRVLDDDLSTFPFDEGVISTTTEGFYNQMRFVRENFDVVTFADLRECERSGKGWPPRGVIVTFDDGYRDNYTNAFPVLRDLKLPATVFLATGHIGEEKLFWWDLIAFCLKQTALESVVLAEVSAQPISLANPQRRKAAISRVLEWVKRAPDEVKQSFLNELSDRLNVNLDDDLAFAMHLSWEEVRTMSDGGIEFGSHTVTHPVLANVSPDRAKDELTISKHAVEREIGKEAVAFAYPVGSKENFNAASMAAVEEAGYSFAVSYEEGVARCGVSHSYALPRIHVETYQSLSLFRANLMFSRVLLGA